MAEPAKLHRKQWEFCYIAQALEERGMLQSDRRGLGFGVGLEPLPALFASFACEVVATDVERGVAEAAGWAQTGQHADTAEVLNDRGLCSTDDFQRLVTYRTVNMNAIPEDLRDFNFLWSACSLEHIGSLEHGKRFIYRAMKCLRPGGIAVHTTEYNMSSNTDTVETEQLSLYRRRDIEEVVQTLQAEGHVVDVNFSEGTAPADQYVDVPPYLALPHLRLEIGNHVTTSLGLIIEKGTKVYTGAHVTQEETKPPGAEISLDEGSAREVLVEAYQRVLGRDPDPWAEQHLLPAMQNGLTREVLLASLVQSQEFEWRQRELAGLDAPETEMTIALQACASAFGPLRMTGPTRDKLVFRHIVGSGGIWEPHITNLLAHMLQPGDTFIDVGANLGYYAIIAGARVGPGGHVLAFEPQPAVHKYCEANVRLNKLSNVTVFPYALWDKPEGRQLWAPDTDYGGAFLFFGDKQELASFPRVDVRCVALDALLESVDIIVPDCHFIKLDIQGAELFALHGMRNLIVRTRPVLLCELHSGCLALFNRTPRDLLQTLEDLEYVCMLNPRAGEVDQFTDLVNVSPWPDVDIRAIESTARLCEVVSELDRQLPPSYTADLVAFPKEMDTSPAGLQGFADRRRAARAGAAPVQRQDGGSLTERIASIPWFHQIDLGQGIVTPGADASALKLQWIRMPDDLRGKTVLDVGTWDGFFAFEAERRGARRVLATDSFVWRTGTPGSKEGFLLARDVLGSHVEDLEVDVMDLDPTVLGSFDLVLCLGVLYHMRDPLLALERVASVTDDQLILETHMDALENRRPMAAFYPGAELNRDATNWWGPNPAAVEGMLRAVGFTRVEMIWSSFDASLAVLDDTEGRFHRAVFHAFK